MVEQDHPATEWKHGNCNQGDEPENGTHGKVLEEAAAKEAKLEKKSKILKKLRSLMWKNLWKTTKSVMARNMTISMRNSVPVNTDSKETPQKTF